MFPNSVSEGESKLVTSAWPPFLCTWLWQHAASKGTMEEKKVFRVRCGKRCNGRIESGWWWWWSCTNIASLSKVGNVEFILLIKSNLLWTVTQDPVGTNEYLIILFGNSTGLWVRRPELEPGWAALCTAWESQFTFPWFTCLLVNMDLIIHIP